MNELALFAGAGGGILGGKLLGWRTVCAVEFDEHARNVLVARQNDGSLEPFPIWDDVRTFDGKPWRGRIDIISGGFPCQDISVAGKQKGLDGERSGLWSEYARIIGEVMPRYCFIENSPQLVRLGLNRVISDLAEMGYVSKWGIVGARHVTNTHKRDRIWILAYSELHGCPTTSVSGSVNKTIYNNTERQNETSESSGGSSPGVLSRKSTQCRNVRTGEEWWATEPELGRVADGVAYRVDRIKRIGNGQVPAVVRLAWNILSSGI
jgi:DNA (cytosine-5)-methyltransferase 1